MFLAALATSSLTILLLFKLAPIAYWSMFDMYRDSLKNMSYLLVTLGGSLMGMGMYISGVCPGNMLVQFGAGVQYSTWTFTGALMGALAYGYSCSYLVKSTKPDLALTRTLYEVFNVDHVRFRILAIILLGGIVCLMEIRLPWTANDLSSSSSSGLFYYTTWPSFVCGIILGLLQFFSLMVLSKSLGDTSSYTILIGLLFCTKKLQQTNPYFAKFRSSMANWMSLCTAVGALLGAFASADLSGYYGKARGVGPYNSMLGGFLLVFGAKIAGASTSGHGISGSSYMFFASLLAVLAMFGSAILIGFAQYTDSFFI
jgi:hypothetical protein